MANKKKQEKKKQKRTVTRAHVAAAQPEAKETRQVLMLKAKERGIKNFRVLNKDELMHVLAEGVTQQEIDALVAGAVARWKSGWGSKKEQQNK
jgi:predicted methyltransferase MtxX (methanogen marker protein 4)